jgi:pimeloyl-ACP methyl ester carboxylesterase
MTERFEGARVDGRVLRYVCGGNGAPSAVIDQGQGLSIERGFDRPVTFGWAKVFGEVEKSTRVLMHDRAGLGSSQPADRPRSSMDMVTDLRAILSAARMQPPYILVGHSVGGLNVRTFAAQFPHEVAGMVLVDSSHPDQIARMAKILPPESSADSPVLKAWRKGSDPASSPEKIDFNRSAEQARALKSLGTTPLVIVSQSPRAFGPPGIPHALWEQMRLEWRDLQSDLLALSSNSRQIVAEHAGHHVQAEEPQLVIDAILEVVKEVRGGGARAH